MSSPTASEHLESDRVRQHTDDDALAQLDGATRSRLEMLAAAPVAEVEAHLRALDDEWDIERVLEVNAASLALSGLALGAFVDRRFLAIPAVVLGLLAQHGVQGWCPPMALFRRMGVRTRREIDAERTAVKALLGRFEGTSRDRGTPAEQARRAHRAALG